MYLSFLVAAVAWADCGVWNKDDFDSNAKCYDEFWKYEDKVRWAACCENKKQSYNWDSFADHDDDDADADVGNNCKNYVPNAKCYDYITVGNRPCDESLSKWLECCDAACWEDGNKRNCSATPECDRLYTYVESYERSTDYLYQIWRWGSAGLIMMIVMTCFIYLICSSFQNRKRIQKAKMWKTSFDTLRMSKSRVIHVHQLGPNAAEKAAFAPPGFYGHPYNGQPPHGIHGQYPTHVYGYPAGYEHPQMVRPPPIQPVGAEIPFYQPHCSQKTPPASGLP